jgi:enoyl-CoA hydratase/carnithine racemase
MSDLILREEEGGVVTLTLSQPELRNPVSDLPTIEALIAEISAADADLNVPAVILTGAGSAFSTGGNIQTMREGGGLNDPLAANTRRNYRRGIQRLPLLFEALEAPVIAAINGPAIGAGCDPACMCDIRIASTSAKFAESFVKLGIVPGDGGAWLLPRIVGFSKASEMAFTGNSLNAQEALGCGLVSKVVEDDQLMGVARALAGRIAANPPHAVRMTKRLLREGRTASLTAILDASAAAQALCHATSDHREAVDAFFEKRTPRFSGS